MHFSTHILPLLLLAGITWANDLALPRIELARDSSAAFALNFSPSPEPVVAFQFEIEYDPQALQLFATVGDAARLAGKALYSAPVSATRTRFIVSGWNQTPIQAGALVQFVAGTTATAALGEVAVNVVNLAATFPNGTSAPVFATGGSVAVIAGTAQRLSDAGVLSAASLIAGPLAPGEIATLLGPGIGPAVGTTPGTASSAPILGGTSVWFDGVQAPLLYAGPTQINVVVPFGLEGDETELVIRKDGEIAANLTVPLTGAAPALFTVGSSGAGPAAILNEDATVNSATNPARPGQVVSLFATGAGAMDPPAADGSTNRGAEQHPVFPVSVRIGGQDAEVLYAGAAPGLIAGTLQVNCRVPEDVVAGPAVEIVLTVGSVPSPAGTTLSVE